MRFPILAVLLAVAGLPRPVHASDGATAACVRHYEQGQESRRERRLFEAREHLAGCAAETCPAVMSRQCTAWIEELLRDQPGVIIAVRRNGLDLPDARIEIDGREVLDRERGTPVELDPGRHVASASYEGQRSTVPFVANLGENRRVIVISLDGEPPPSGGAVRPATVAGISIVGLGAVALGLFVGYAASAQIGYDEAKDECDPACDRDRLDTIETNAATADVFLAIGAPTTSLGIGILVIDAIVSHGAPATAAGLRVTFD